MKHTIESSDFRINRSKIEYLQYSFTVRDEDNGEITINEMIVQGVENFRYLGSVIDDKGDMDKDINHQMRA